MTDDDQASPVDWQAARTLTGGDQALLDELIELFPGESARHLETIRSAIQGGDGAALARAAHTLKSAARMFGAEALAAEALDIEQLGQAGDVAGAQDRVPSLEAETARVLAALEQARPGR